MFTVVCKGGLRTDTTTRDGCVHVYFRCMPRAARSTQVPVIVEYGKSGIKSSSSIYILFQQSLNKMASTENPELTPEETLAIDCTGLTYAFAEGLESALDGVDLQLKKGDRCLVVGANGGM